MRGVVNTRSPADPWEVTLMRRTGGATYAIEERRVFPALSLAFTRAREHAGKVMHGLGAGAGLKNAVLITNTEPDRYSIEIKQNDPPHHLVQLVAFVQPPK